ncbi:MAG TPA: DUF4983 domain-containing protein [Niabella sp.]|nr:DUF4983 domain-containing protein [Niabella sp.]HQX20873.1 DUF4983 domain-containing protein [Niabella sp.]HRB08353.1 DUF4983 domain-containing protein [Niabella sp.]HRB48558.1 DUF4983 domain-containing protein [Niabella sp.]HRB51763.1 DUF4983 domain-containing protein [Niabella sp.]
MKHILLTFLVGAGLALLVGSCRKYADPPPYFEEDSTEAVVGKRKVLLIGIDGLPGKEFMALNPPTLVSMLPKSKFTLTNAVDDAVTTDAASWKTLLSGVTYAKHKVKDSTFESLNQAGEGQTGSNFPSLFYFIIRSAKPDLQSRFVSDWPDMLNLMTPEVSFKVKTNNDASTKDSVVAALKSKNDDLLVVHFNGASIAGKAGAFSAADAGYKAAVVKIDSYINEIMTALKARPGYNKEEDWLVIITGTHGGVNNTYGGGSEAETFVPSLYYNEKFKKTEFIKADYSSALLTGRDGNAVNARVLNDGGLYDIGTGSQTMQLKIKGTNPFNWPHFMGKTTGFTQQGWTIFTNSSGAWCYSIRTSTVGERRLQPASPNVFDGNWHTLTVVLYDSAGSRWVKRFTDGKRVEDVTSTRNLGSASGTISSTSPFSLGWGGDKGFGAMTYNVSDVQIFNTSMTDQEVNDNLCLKDLTKHAKYSSLIGYWPCNDGFGSGFKNLAPGKANYPLTLSGPYSWLADPVLPCNLTATPQNAGQSQLVLSSASVPSTIFYWLKVSVNTRWGIEPSNWLMGYEQEFLGIQ